MLSSGRYLRVALQEPRAGQGQGWRQSTVCSLRGEVATAGAPSSARVSLEFQETTVTSGGHIRGMGRYCGHGGKGGASSDVSLVGTGGCVVQSRVPGVFATWCGGESAWKRVVDVQGSQNSRPRSLRLPGGLGQAVVPALLPFHQASQHLLRARQAQGTGRPSCPSP